MKDQHVIELLESTAERVPVGRPPVATMVGGARRARRRRLGATLAGAAAAAAVAGVVLGTTLLGGPDADDDRAPLATDPSPAPAPPGMRLVGLGQVAIAVPEEWATNDLHCGVPQGDTVVVDVAVIPACDVGREPGVDSVEVSTGPPDPDLEVAEKYAVDGVVARRSATTCRSDLGGVRVCEATVHFPTLGVTFEAASSTDESTVDEILSRIRYVPDLSGVPGYAGLVATRPARARDLYLKHLMDEQLRAETTIVAEPGHRPGQILDVDPAPGTMLEPGSVVTVTVAGGPTRSE